MNERQKLLIRIAGTVACALGVYLCAWIISLSVSDDKILAWYTFPTMVVFGAGFFVLAMLVVFLWAERDAPDKTADFFRRLVKRK